jgi:hypothetical protein
MWLSTEGRVESIAARRFSEVSVQALYTPIDQKRRVLQGTPQKEPLHLIAITEFFSRNLTFPLHEQKRDLLLQDSLALPLSSDLHLFKTVIAFR